MEAAIKSLDLQNVIDVHAKWTDTATENKVHCDTAFREVILELLARDDTRLDDILKIVSLAFEGSKPGKEVCSKQVGFVMLGDILETSAVETGDTVFEYCEEKLPTWKASGFIECSKISILRMCNDLLRRLSQTLNTSFYGRVLVFLAKCLPLNEKSGLNLGSQFNTDNVTRFDNEENEELGNREVLSPGEDMEVEEGEMKEGNTGTDVPVDYALYCKFWQLQTFFADPSSCFDKLKWRKFQHNAIQVLDIFAGYKLEDDNSRKRKHTENGDSEGGKKSKNDEPMEETSTETEEESLALRLRENLLRRQSKEGVPQKDAYFAKYLTSQKLLQLQLNDSQFRRYVLLQFLITFQYLLADVKFKDKMEALTLEQSKWVEESIQKCHQLLSETYPVGPKFSQAVKNILEREKHWSDWKNQSCSDFSMRKDDKRPVLFKKRPRKKYDPNEIDLANPELTRLWSLSSNTIAACADPSRNYVPDLEVFLEEPWDQADPDAGIEQQYKVVYNENFQWRAMRLLMSESASFMEKNAWNINAKDMKISELLPNRLEKCCVYAGNQMKKFQELKKQRIAEAAERKKHQAEMEEKEKAEEEARREGLLANSGDNPVTEAMIKDLAPLIGKKWQKLAEMFEIPAETVDAYKKKSNPSEVVLVLLTEWVETEGDDGSTRKLSTKLLEAELYDEHVKAVLSRVEETATEETETQAAEKPAEDKSSK